MGLDFYLVTEHNNLPSSWPKGKLLVIPGIEFTSFGRGDWNAIGLTQWLDCWGTDVQDGGMSTDEGQLRLFNEARSLGIICSVNHPMSGRFSWRFPQIPLDKIDVLEI
ncbi:MAG: hypothetical protein K0Q73_4651 [Paenibacillus sp.]|nr:hypothetical protein [Paenibacillus sp.]